jgi:hypothetical protein
VYPTLSETTRAAIDHYGGARSQTFVDTMIARQQDEQDIQERMYEYGGLPGSIGAQMVGAVLNPVDWAIAVTTFGAGKAVTTMNTIRNITNKYRKTSGAFIGATEGLVSGYASEAIRQETGGIYDEDARYDVALFGTVLNGTLGAKGWIDFLNEQDVETTHRILNSLDKDTQYTRQHFQVNDEGMYKNLGSGATRWEQPQYDVDDFQELPKVPKAIQFMSKLSPKGNAYNVLTPTYRKLLEKLTGSDVALVKPDGTYHTQSNFTAEDYKTVELDGLKGSLANELAGAFNEFKTFRKEQGLPSMSEKEFGEYLYTQRIEANKKFREVEAEIEYLKNKEGDNTAKIAKLESLVIEPTFDSPAIARANKALDTYYGEMDFRRTEFQRQRDGIEDATMKPSTSYTTRVINKETFKFDSNTKNRLLTALMHSPTAKAISKYEGPEAMLKYHEEMQKVVENMVAKIKASTDSVTLDELTGSRGGAASTLEKGKFSTQRRIDIDENLMGDLLERDMFGIIDYYHRDTGGRIAIRKAFDDEGINTWEDFKTKYGTDMAKEFDIAGMSRSEIDAANHNLKKVFDTIRGTADITSNPNSWFNQTKNAVTALQNIRFGLGFGAISLSELGPAMAVGGIKTLKYLKPAFADSLRKVTNKEVATEFIQELQGMGIGIDLQHSKTIERYVEGRSDFESNKIINALRQGESAAFRYGGLTVVTDTLKSALGGAYTSRVINVGNRLHNGGVLTTHEKAMFSRHGLTESDLRDIANAPIETDANGLLKSFNFEAWDSELAFKMKKAITTAVKGNILEPTAMDLPWDTSSPFKGLLFQYLRFPVAATPKLLQRAIAEKDLGALMGAMVSTLITVGNTYLLTQIASKTGEVLGITESNPYDDLFNDEEQQKKLALEIWNKNPYLGIFPTLTNVALSVAGEPAVGQTYRQGASALAGPGISYAYQVGDALVDIVREPGELTTGQAHAIKTSIPILAAPFFKELRNNYMEENY